jgi:hypothetical protein
VVAAACRKLCRAGLIVTRRPRNIEVCETVVAAAYVNDTGASDNPGCKSVRQAVDALAADAGYSVQAAFPVGYWADYFRALAVSAREVVLKRPGYLRSGGETAREVPLDLWLQARDRAAADDPDFRRVVDSVDVLLVNGEGSIHHNFPRALALLALIDVAAGLGKQVLLINATIQAMDEALLGHVLPRLRVLHVREPDSLAAVSPYCPSAFCAADIAALTIAGMRESAARPERRPAAGRRCFVSAGVLAEPVGLRRLLAAALEAGFRPTYFSIGDGNEGKVAAAVCADLQVDHLRACDIPLAELFAMLRDGFDLALSGRHHLNLFLMAAGVPFLPLPSNTWKIPATLSYLGYPVAVCERLDDLPMAIEKLWQARHDVGGAGLAAFDAALASLDGFAKRIAA